MVWRYQTLAPSASSTQTHALCGSWGQPLTRTLPLSVSPSSVGELNSILFPLFRTRTKTRAMRSRNALARVGTYRAFCSDILGSGDSAFRREEEHSLICRVLVLALASFASNAWNKIIDGKLFLIPYPLSSTTAHLPSSTH